MGFADAFAEIVRPQEPLAPYTYLRIGGPAEYLVEPRTHAELGAVLHYCQAEHLPVRVLGNGCNLVVRDEGVPGVVVRLNAEVFTEITVSDRRVRAGGGALLSALVTQAAKHHLAGLETLVGILGTVGGAIRCNAGDRTSDIGQFVRAVEVLDETGSLQRRDRSEMHFSEHQSELDDPVILTVELELDTDSADAIVKRMRKAWIQRKGSQPFTFQHAVRAFKNPKGYTAANLIEQAGVGHARVGGAMISERNANYIVTQPGTFARDVLRLIDLVQTRVQEHSGICMEREVLVW